MVELVGMIFEERRGFVVGVVYVVVYKVRVTIILYQEVLFGGRLLWRLVNMHINHVHFVR